MCPCMPPCSVEHRGPSTYPITPPPPALYALGSRDRAEEPWIEEPLLVLGTSSGPIAWRHDCAEARIRQDWRARE